jgi:predicted nucleotidyltransferase
MIALTASTLDAATAAAAAAFTARVRARYPVGEAILFGSRARGQFRPDSDADVTVVLRGPPGDFVATKLAMADIAFDVLLETGVRVQPLPVWEDEWQHPESYSNPRLLANVRREGILL